jgi:hypothetical protein
MRFLSAVVVSTVLLTTSLRAQQEGANEGISITAIQINESRHKRLVDDKRPAARNSLNIQLRLKGDAIKKLTRLGNWKVTAAKDDQGNDLVNRSSFTSKTLYRTYRRYSTVGRTSPPPQDEYETSSQSVNAPNRGAKALAVFQGTVDVSLSDYDSVSIPVAKLDELKGKEIADPLLKKAGLTVTLDRLTSMGNNTNLSIKFTGTKDDQQKFLRLRFEDKDGKTITESNASPGFSRGYGSLYSFRKLPADAVLKFDIETRRKDVTLRFDLKDLPLP